MQQELAELEALRTQPSQPFMLILGGNKLPDKIPLINRFLQAQLPHRVHTIMLGGALSHAFLKAMGHEIGVSDITNQAVDLAGSILGQAAKQQVSLMLPVDIMAITGPLGSKPKAYTVNQIPKNAQIVDIGPKTCTQFAQIIPTAQTIFTNGTMGLYEYPDYQQGTKSILKDITESTAHTVVAGGDAAAATNLFGLEDQIDFISTGGGATLSYLSAESPMQELPGLCVFFE